MGVVKYGLWVYLTMASEIRSPGKICAVKRAVGENLDLLGPEFFGENSGKLFQNFQIWNSAFDKVVSPMKPLGTAILVYDGVVYYPCAQ